MNMSMSADNDETIVKWKEVVSGYMNTLYFEMTNLVHMSRYLLLFLIPSYVTMTRLYSTRLLLLIMLKVKWSRKLMSLPIVAIRVFAHSTSVVPISLS